MGATHRLGRLAVSAVLVAALGGCGERKDAHSASTVPRTAQAASGSSAQASTIAAPPAWSPAMEEVVVAANGFACDLYAVRRGVSGNLFFSPLSLHTALAMTAVGTRAATREQLLRGLHLADDDAVAASGDLGRILVAPDGDVLSVANALWGQTGLDWQPSFRDTLTARFGAGVEEADFAADPEAQRQRINAWVGERTRGRIGDLIAPSMLSPLTRIVLTNAIAFKADWADQFDAKRTEQAPFYAAAEQEIEVPLMHRRGMALHAEIEDGQLLVLPYVGGVFEMLVALPRQRDGLSTLEAGLTADAVAAWRSAVVATDVDIWLPRFRLEDDFLVNADLRTLGVDDLFDPNRADLSGMSSESTLVVSAVVHKAFVEVDEEGTVAAAATAVVTDLPSPPPPKPVVFRADHPFVFMIRHARSGTILFLGRLVTPTR